MCVVWGWMGVWVNGCVCVLKKKQQKEGGSCKKELNPRAGKLRAVEVGKETFKFTLCTDFKA